MRSAPVSRTGPFRAVPRQTGTTARPEPIPKRSCCGALLDRVDTIRVEGEMVLDLGDRGVRRLIGPDGIHRSLPAEWDAVVVAFALVGAIGLVRGPLQPRHVHVLAWDSTRADRLLPSGSGRP